MTKQSKVWIALGAVPLLAALCLLVLNIYVQSSSVKSRITEALQESLGAHVEIQRISYTPWGGVRLGNIRIAGQDGDADMFSAPHFTAKVNLRSVFTANILIEEVLLDSPNITLTPESSFTQKVAPTTVVIADVPETTPTPDTAPTPWTGEPAPVPERKKSSKSRTATIQQAVVNNGKLQYFNKDKERIVLLEKIRIRSDLSKTSDVHGDILIERGLFADRMALTEIKSPFRYADEKFDLPQLTAEIAGGTLEGTFTWEEKLEENPAVLALHFKEADLSELLAGASLQSERFSGKLSGSLKLQGAPEDADTFKGKGQLELSGGEFRQVEFLRAIGDALKIEEISHLKLNKAHAIYKIRGKDIQIQELRLEATNLKLEARGWIREGEKLKLDAKLFFNRNIQKKLPSLAKSNMTPMDDEYSALEFDIRGTVSNPDTNLVERLIGEKLEKEVKDLFKRILGRDSKKDNKP